MRSNMNRRDFARSAVALASLLAASKAAVGCSSASEVNPAGGAGGAGGVGGASGGSGGASGGSGGASGSGGSSGNPPGDGSAASGRGGSPSAEAAPGDGGVASDGSDGGGYYRGDLKVALNAFSFDAAMLAQLAGTGSAMSLMTLLDWCADPAHQFDALDATGYYFPPGNLAMPTAQYLQDFKQKASDLGIVISGTGIRNDFANPSATVRADGVTIFKRWCGVANAIGAPMIRVFAGPAPAGYAWDTVAAWVADSLKQCADAARAAGLKVALQNHADFLSTSDQTIQMLNLVNMPDVLGVNDDTGSFDDGGPLGIDAKYAAIARLLPYAINMQVKTIITPAGQTPTTPMDLMRLLRVIRSGPYRGYLPIETLAQPGTTYDPFANVPKFLTSVRDAIAQTAAG
jgi:sugar phosphate isomerase/epimerase